MSAAADNVGHYQALEREARAAAPRLADNPLCRCDDCGAECRESELAKSLFEVHHLADRLDVGGIVPAGECECGAFAYVVQP